MDKLSTNKVMTTREVAEALGLKDNSSVTRVAKKCLPNKRIEHGKATFWTEEELTVLLDYIKSNPPCNPQLQSSAKLAEVTETSLTANLKAAQFAEQLKGTDAKQLSLLTVAFIAEIQRRCDELAEESKNLKITLDVSKSFASVKLMEKLNPNRKFDWRVLKDKSKELSCKIEKCIDQNYGEVNAYSKEVWEACYELDVAPWD